MAKQKKYKVGHRPCQTPNDQAYEVRVYLVGEIDPQIYTRVKHIFWQRNVLVIVQYKPNGSFRYVNWTEKQVSWYGVEPDGKFVAKKSKKKGH